MPALLKKEKLWTRNFVLMCLANFLFFFSFYLLMPTLPYYLMDFFKTTKGTIGLVLSSYTIAVLAIRPFSGFLADSFSRKPIYIIAYFLFVSLFIGYLFAGVLTLFIAFRIFHGFTFGAVSTAGNTLVIDIMPSSRRGEGLGYFGATNNLALAFGPMVGLFLKNTANFESIFFAAIISGSLGLFFASLVKAPKKVCCKRDPISLDRFILIKGMPAAISLVLITIPYGMTNTYIAIYAERLGMISHTGYFFLMMSVGLILSRILSGKKVDQGHMSQIIKLGYIIVLMGVFGEIFLHYISQINIILGYLLLFSIAFLLGYGYGTLIPALNTLFINLAPHNRRATANSTYLTSWDVGIGTGILLGGYLSDWVSFSFMYGVGAFLSTIALFLYIYYVIAHYNKNKLV